MLQGAGSDPVSAKEVEKDGPKKLGLGATLTGRPFARVEAHVKVSSKSRRRVANKGGECHFCLFHGCQQQLVLAQAPCIEYSAKKSWAARGMCGIWFLS